MEIQKLDAIVPQRDNRFAKRVGMAILWFFGWKIEGTFPKRSKFVVAVAPHTSNWDFVIAVAAMLALQIKIKFLGKDAIFIWPFKLWLKSIGGIPVERSTHHGVVEQMVSLFNQNDKLVLAIAPEGTRLKTKQWKRGFLHIAHQAKVPVVPLSLDFNKKIIHVYPSVFVQEDIEQALEQFKTIFTNISPKNPQFI